MACKNLPFLNQLIIGIIFMIGGPFFAISGALETILNYLMPDGWGNDDDDFKGC